MPQPLPSKERSLFQQVVKNYESKQYKKGIKAADQILRKVPDHGDTQAMKALILNAQNQTDEAFRLAKDALKSDMKSHICWHVYGLLYRSAKNFEESIKAYRVALRWEPDSQQIQRDLAMLQVQMRDYEGYASSRHAMLQARPGWRANWTALAIAQHLSGNLGEAEKTLTTYEETLKTPPPKADLEHQEAVLYKNKIIAEMGQTERALDHLNSEARRLSDQQTVLELRAEYLLKLGHNREAAGVYRQLIDRNPEYRAYYRGLEEALELDRGDTKTRQALYAEYAEKNKRGDAAFRIPLDFLTGLEFERAADLYLRRKLNRGVPSTFANLKALYVDVAKRQTLVKLVEGYNSDQDVDEPIFKDSVLYFLAQHYDYHMTRNLAKASEAIEKLLIREPTSVDYLMTKARIRKHQGDLQGASEVMERARASDEKDRYINTKAAKYQLRNDQNQEALANMSKFTKPDAPGGPLADLTDMQSIWFMTEEGESRLRQQQIGLALKRFHTIHSIYEVWQEDQYDFHGFSLRKGQIRAYIDMLKWEDELRRHPFYVRAALGGIKAYLKLADDPSLANGNLTNGGGTDLSERKKAAKKARKEAERIAQLEHERRDAKKTAGAASDGDSKKPDPDPEGKQLMASQQPLEDSVKFLAPLLEHALDDSNVQDLGFEVSLRRRKWLPALRCLLAARQASRLAFVHSAGIRLRAALVGQQAGMDQSVLRAIEDLGATVMPPSDTNLMEANERFLASSARFQDQIAGLKIRWELDKSSAHANTRHLVQLVESQSLSLEDVSLGLDAVRRWRAPTADYMEAARRQWPLAKVFKDLH